jgi:hypothetical protein
MTVLIQTRLEVSNIEIPYARYLPLLLPIQSQPSICFWNEVPVFMGLQ